MAPADAPAVPADDAALMKAASDARRSAYAPYSSYRVGAAVRDETGCVHVGCNVENSSFPLGTCAETNAIGAMVAAGGRKIAAIAVVGGRDETVGTCTPCGGCRQAIQEFADTATVILLLDESNTLTRRSADDLLPASFHLPPT